MPRADALGFVVSNMRCEPMRINSAFARMPWFFGGAGSCANPLSRSCVRARMPWFFGGCWKLRRPGETDSALARGCPGFSGVLEEAPARRDRFGVREPIPWFFGARKISGNRFGPAASARECGRGGVHPCGHLLGIGGGITRAAATAEDTSAQRDGKTETTPLLLESPVPVLHP